LELQQLPDDQLGHIADVAHKVRIDYCGEGIEVESIISGKTGGCPEDCHFCSQSSVFGTEVATIPAQVPYLRAPPERVATWKRRLGPAGGLRVGLAWRGAQHIPKRSLPIECLLPVLVQPGLELHALQQEIPAEQRAWLQAHAPLFDHSAALHDFADTAALIAQLDLVVTIDTSVAHLAGALGKPVWILLRHSADWRWLLNRDDNPWYPTARLFRQHRPGDWDGVVADVSRALQAVARR